MLEHHQLAGLLGVAVSLFAYARVQWRRDFAKTISYSVLNFSKASLLIYSLSYQWHLAAFVGNTIWGAISLYGVYRCLKYKHREKAAQTALAEGKISS